MKTLLLTVVLFTTDQPVKGAAQVEYELTTNMTCTKASALVRKQYTVPKGYGMEIHCKEKM